jgi:radical SAM protein with 4Fe4S-binding SPASM domain
MAAETIPAPASHALTKPITPEIREALDKASAGLRRVFAVPGLTREKRLEHARGINRQLRRLEYQHGVTEVGSFPGILELPVAGKCNLRCEMCGLTHGHALYPNWTYEEVARFKPFLPYADLVNPTGAGEPLLVKDFFRMLALFSEHKTDIGFFTNATQLNAEKIDQLIAMRIGTISISIDGATREVFEKIRHPAKFDVVVENARALVRRRRELGSVLPRLQIAMVLMQDNLHELSALVRLAKDIGAEGVYTMFVSRVHTPQGKPVFDHQLVERTPAKTNAALHEAKAVARELGIRFLAPAPLPEPDSSSSPDAPAASAATGADPQTSLELLPGQVLPERPADRVMCSHPWNQYVVWNDGAVSPCCRIRDDVDGLKFGNIRDSDPATLWNSPAMVRLRERLATGCPPAACIRCPLRTGAVS